MVTAAQLIANVSVQGATQAATALEGVGGTIAGLAAAGGVALVGLGIQSVKMAGDFQSGMTSLVTGAGESKANLQQVSDGILSLATSTGTTTKQLTDGMYMIESAGFHGAQGLSVLQAAAQGAKVGNADLGTVANAVTSVMHDYASSNLTATQATNALITTVASGKTHMEDIASSLSAILPLASSLHIPFNQVAGAMATMTNAGMTAQHASQNLAFAIRALNVETPKGTQALKDIGLTAEQVHNDLQTKGLPATLKEIEDHIGKQFPLDSMKGQQALKDIMGGAAGLNAALMIGGSHMKEFEGDVNSIGSALSSKQKDVQGWSEVQGDFNQKLAQAQEVVETLGIKLGTALLPFAGKVVDAFSQFASWLSSPSVTNFATGVGKNISDAFKNIGDVLNSPAMRTIGSMFVQLGSIIGSAFLPVLKQLQTTWETQLLPAFQKMLPALAPIGALIGGVIVVALGLLVATIVGVAKAIAGFLTGWIQVWGGVIQIISGAVQIIGGILKAIWDLFHGNFAAVGKDLQGVWQGVIQIFQGFGNVFMGLVRAVIGTITGLFSGFVQGIITFFTNMAAVLVGHSIIPDMINAIIQWFTQLPGRVLGIISGFVSSAISTFLNFATMVGAAVQSLVNNAVNTFQQLPGRVLGALQGLGASIAGFFSGLAGQAAAWGAGIVSGLISGINSMVGAAGQAAANVVNSVKSFLGFHSPAEKGEGRYIVEWGQGMIQGFEQGIINATPHLQATVDVAVSSSLKGLNLQNSNSYVPTGASVIANNTLSQSTQQQPQITVQSPNIYLDGRLIANGLMPQITNAIRYGTGINNF